MPLDVIGAGLGRTGTMSLKLALEQLGLGPCYHMVEVFKHPTAPGLWSAVADGQPPAWETIFAGYRSTVDWPSATYYKALADAFPAAKVILTHRDGRAWFRSTQATIFARSGAPTAALGAMVEKTVYAMFDGRMNDREHMIEVYERHNAEVRRLIPAERLLIYDIAEGWSPLCRFLGRPEPKIPLPNVNSTAEFQSRQPSGRA